MELKVNFKYIKYDDDFSAITKKYLKKICVGENDKYNNFENISLRLYNRIIKKNKSTTYYGMISEFFLHIIILENGYSQKFKFLNLEEGSIKKGFDGFYKKGPLLFIMESKSSFKYEENDKNSKHINNVKKSYMDVKNKIQGKNGGNDPFFNAFNHVEKIKSNQSIIKKLVELSDDFLMKEDIIEKEFGIIPCSTIFIKDEKNNINVEEETIKINLEKYLKKTEFSSVDVYILDLLDQDKFVTDIKLWGEKIKL